MTTHELFEALESLLSSAQKNPDAGDKASHDLIRELQVHQLELEIQNRELRATQQQLTHTRIRYAHLYDFSPIGYASLDESARIAEINITGGKLLGDNPHKLIGREFYDFISADDIQAFKLHWRRSRWSRQKKTIELRLKPIEGTPLDVQ